MTTTPTTRASLLLKLGNPHDHQAWVEFVALYEPVIYRMLKKAGLQEVDAGKLCRNCCWPFAEAWIVGGQGRNMVPFGVGFAV